MCFLILIALSSPEVWSDFQQNDYTLVYDKAVFSGITDHVSRLCYNDNTIFGYNTNKPSWCFQIESEYYDSNSELTSSEMIFSWDDNDSTYVRPLQLNCMWETDLCSLRTEGQLELRRTDGLEGWRMDEDLRLRAVNGFLSNWVNNDAWIFQKDAYGVERSLIRRRNRNVVIGENGDQASILGRLAVGFFQDASAMLHVQMSETVDAMYIPFRLQPTITTGYDVYGWWQYLTVNTVDDSYISSLKSIWVDPPTVNLGDNSTVGHTTTLYVGGASDIGTIDNYALHVGGATSLSKIDGALVVGILRLLSKQECIYFNEDYCFVVEDGSGIQYEIPAYELP
jgi:hypothetical protein